MKNLFAIVVLVLFSSLIRQSYAADPACEDARYQDFDFWLGHWDVKTPDGQFAGVNLIEKQYDGCVVTERYANASGPYGTSVNSYDKTTGKWHQTWVDRSGLRLPLEGGLVDGVMVLTGNTSGQSGDLNHKISWTPEENGSVIQHWQVRKADETQWQTLFKGIYTKKTD